MRSIELVKKFNEKFNIDDHHLKEPGFPTEDIIQYRLKFLFEELQELAHACGYHIMSGQIIKNYFKGEESEQQDLGEALDALVDLEYVLAGTILFFGMDRIFNEAFDRVHTANMQKEKVNHVNESKRDHILDIKKPAGWKAPTFEDLLKIK